MTVRELLEKCGETNTEVRIYSFSTRKECTFLTTNDAVSEYGDRLVFTWTVEGKREIFIRIDHC